MATPTQNQSSLQPLSYTRKASNSLKQKLWILPQQFQRKHPKLPQFYSKKDILNASIMPGTDNNYSSAINRLWLFNSNRLNNSIPTWEVLIKSGSIKDFDRLISDYITCKFNQTGNNGDTLSGEFQPLFMASILQEIPLLEVFCLHYKD